MIDLLLKIYYPFNGQILFDDTDINLFNNSSLRNKISYVSQDALFFNRSIDENLNLLTDDSKDFSELFDQLNLSNFKEIKIRSLVLVVSICHLDKNKNLIL